MDTFCYFNDSDEDTHINRSKKYGYTISNLNSSESDDITVPFKASLETENKWKKPGINPKQLSLKPPKNFKDWLKLTSKGCFYMINNKILSHQFHLDIAQKTLIWLTIEPLCLGVNDLNSRCESNGNSMDMIFFIFDNQDQLISFSDHKNQKGKYGLAVELKKGIYKFIAFTTGCRFKPNVMSTRSNKTNKKKDLFKRTKKGDIQLTTDFENVLSDIFDTCDLDSNGLLSREEFNLFSTITCNNEKAIGDEEWIVVLDRVSTMDGEITKQGFLELHQMDADENDGDEREFFDILQALGYNDQLILDKASPFLMEVYVEKGDAFLKVMNIDFGKGEINSAFIQLAKEQNNPKISNGNKTILIHTLLFDARCTIIAENMSRSQVSMEIDCHESENLISNRPNIKQEIKLQPDSFTIVHHLVPVNESQAWTLHYKEICK